MGKKALFFDIDGTLISNETKQIPDSTVRALIKARAAGHMVFINTGRVICHIRRLREEIQADGFLCGCGTYIETNNQILYSRTIPHQRGIEIKNNLKKYEIPAWLEGKEGLYLDKAPDKHPRLKFLRDLAKRDGVLSEFNWDDDCYDFDKFCIIAEEDENRNNFLETIRDDFNAIDRGNHFYECVPKGHTKATAIEKILQQYHIPLEDAYVFGDSTNDLAMFEYVPNAVLMGEHSKELEPYASFITKTVEEDGIEYALSTLGIIKI